MFSLHMKKLDDCQTKGLASSRWGNLRIVRSVYPKVPFSQNPLQAAHGDRFFEFLPSSLHPLQSERFLFRFQPVDSSVVWKVWQCVVA